MMEPGSAAGVTPASAAQSTVDPSRVEAQSTVGTQSKAGTQSTVGTQSKAGTQSKLGTQSTVGIIGAGRVGAVLGAALARAGYRIVVAPPTSPASHARRSHLLRGAEVAVADQLLTTADIVLLAVPDDALAGLVRGLAASGAVRAGLGVAHTSGAHGISVLEPLARLGARPIALHPAMTFTGTERDLDRLAEGISFGVTTTSQSRSLATRIVADLGGSVEWVAEQDRPLYHAALTHGANHLVTLVNESLDLLRGAGVAYPQRVAAPLLRAALENTLRHGDEALTGPVSRGDAGTVARHLAVLQAAAPGSVAPYLALARRTADRAIATGRLRPAGAGEVLRVLQDAVGLGAVAAPAEIGAGA